MTGLQLCDDIAALTAPCVDQVVDLAVANVRAGLGGPFAAVVVDGRDGREVARRANHVTTTPDPTAHAEVLALRAAAMLQHRPSLDGLVVLASCEPCPMCLAACLWARVDGVVWLATRQDAQSAGFDDAAFHEALGVPQPLPSSLAHMRLVHLTHPRAREPFAAWRAYDARVAY